MRHKHNTGKTNQGHVTKSCDMQGPMGSEVQATNQCLCDTVDIKENKIE